MTTTAQFRELARQAEKAADWTQAAAMWGAAVEHYPNPKGALAQRDLAALTAKRDAARKSALAEARIDTSDFNYAGSPHHY